MQEHLSWSDGFFEASDKTRLFYRIRCPANPKKSLIIFHGFGEHAHRYEKFARFFPDFQIAIYDMRGMGQSQGRKVWVDSYDRFEQDALDFISFLDKKYPVQAPRVLLGHSMGGLTLMLLHLKHSVSATQFVFSAPCFRVAVPAIALSLNEWINRFYPGFLYHHPVHYQNLSHDKFEMLSYKNDPWIMRDMTARLLHEMKQAGDYVIKTENITFDMPVHFLLAGEDRLVRRDVAEDVYSRLLAPAKTLKIYKNFYHEVFNESEQLLVFRDLQKILA